MNHRLYCLSGKNHWRCNNWHPNFVPATPRTSSQVLGRWFIKPVFLWKINSRMESGNTIYVHDITGKVNKYLER